MSDYLVHYGILGQKWGKTNGPPYPLSYDAHSREEKRLAKKDSKWIKKNEDRIKKKAFNKSEKEMREYVKELSRRSDSYLTNGRLSATYINNYNRKLAEVMNRNVGDIQAPSGKVVKFVAKRGELGVFTALADAGYDMNQVKNGVWSNARIGYKKDTLGFIHSTFHGENFLLHYGIPNMKWGVRNGPPYPIHSANRDFGGSSIGPSSKSKDIETRIIENGVIIGPKNSVVKDSINNGFVKLNVKESAQRRHISGDGYEDGNGLLYGDLETAQHLINKLATTGEPVYVTKTNKWVRKERVTNDKIIGKNLEGIETKNGMIVYSKNGSHIYPR